MTFDDLWADLVKQQPRLALGSETVMFSVAGFRELLKQVYFQGIASGRMNPQNVLSSDALKGMFLEKP